MTSSTVTLGTAHAIPTDSVGLNGADVKSQVDNWNQDAFITELAKFPAGTLRWFGGTTANIWTWDPGFAEGGKKNGRTQVTLSVERLAHVTVASGKEPVFDLNLASLLPRDIDNNYQPPSLADQTAMLAAATVAMRAEFALLDPTDPRYALKDTWTPKYIELGNESYLSDPPWKFTQPAPQQYKSLSSNPAATPVGWVYDWSNPMGDGIRPGQPGDDPSKDNVRGQDELAMLAGWATTGYPEYADRDVPPGHGAAGGAVLYAVRCNYWIAALRAIYPSARFLVHMAPTPASTAGGLSSGQRRAFNIGLRQALTALTSNDYLVPHTYWSSGLTYTYGTSAPSIIGDPATDSTVKATVDATLGAADRRYQYVVSYNLADPGTPTYLGSVVHSPAWLQSVKPIMDLGVKFWGTEFNFNDSVAYGLTGVGGVSTNGSSGVVGTQGSWTHLLSALTGGLEMLSDSHWSRLNLHSTVGGSPAFAAMFSKTQPYAMTHNARTVSGSLGVDGGLFHPDIPLDPLFDVGAVWQSGGFFTTIVAVNDDGSGELAGLPGFVSSLPFAVTATIDPIPSPQWWLNPSAGGAVVPLYSRSVNGHVAYILHQAANGQTSLTPLAFDGALKVNDTGSTAPGLIGCQWTGSKTSGVIVNLRGEPVTLDLTATALPGVAVEFYNARPDVPITTIDRADIIRSVKTATTSETIPAYGVMRFDSTGVSLADDAPPGQATQTIQLATYAQAQSLATTAAAGSVQKSVGTAPGLLGFSAAASPVFIDPGSTAGQALLVDPTAAAKVSPGNVSIARLAETHASLAQRTSTTGAFKSGNVGTGKFSDDTAAWFTPYDPSLAVVIRITSLGTTSGVNPGINPGIAGDEYSVSVYNSGANPSVTLVPYTGNGRGGPSLVGTTLVASNVGYTMYLSDGTTPVSVGGRYYARRAVQAILTTTGDLLTVDTTGTLVRLAHGATGTAPVVQSNGTLAYGFPTTSPTGAPTPDLAGFKSWNTHPKDAQTAGTFATTGKALYARMIATGGSITEVCCGLGTGTGTLTAGTLFAGIRAADGTTITVSGSELTTVNGVVQSTVVSPGGGSDMATLINGGGTPKTNQLVRFVLPTTWTPAAGTYFYAVLLVASGSVPYLKVSGTNSGPVLNPATQSQNLYGETGTSLTTIAGATVNTTAGSNAVMTWMAVR